MANRKRNIQMKFYVTEEEKQLIEQKMQQLPTQRYGAYLRKMAIDGYIINMDTTDIKAFMITAQNEMLDAYIAKHGYILAGETIALENGTQKDRNSIKKIIHEAENKSYDILLISHLDRLMRDTIPCMELCRELLEMGVRIIPVKSGMEFTMKMIEPYSFIKEAQKNRYKHHVPRNAACGVCGKNPMTVQGCRIGFVYVGGQLYPRIPFYGAEGERCYDCNALSGHFHHWGCDDERCPVCGGQLIGCDCEGVECPTGK